MPTMVWRVTYRWAKRIIITVFGFSVLLIGVVMIVTPGPALVVIPAGLGILGLEFAWARRWLEAVKQRIRDQARRHKTERSDEA